MQVAEQTPLTAARIGQLALDAGLPAGVLQIIQVPTDVLSHSAETVLPAWHRCHRREWDPCATKTTASNGVAFCRKDRYSL